MTVDEAIALAERGWIVGSNIEGHSFWMKWIHGYEHPARDRSIDADAQYHSVD